MFKLVTVTLACAAIAFSQKPEGFAVLKVSVETQDSIAFQVSVRKGVYGADENIDVYYQVHNRSKKTIYLVTKDSDEISISDSWVAELPDPIDSPDAHTRYSYRMIKIPPGKSYRGKRTVEAKKLNEHPKYSFDETEIQARFAYLFDISGLDECSYSLPCLRKVYDDARIVKLGNLVVHRKV